MKRRDFIKTILASGFALFFPNLILPKKTLAANENYDLVAVRGGNPDAMFYAAMKELGGIEKYVRKGQTVVVKPNIGWDVPPERAANTNPLLVGAIVKACIDAGAKKVYVFDNTCDNWQRAYSNSGIERAVKQNGGEMVPGNFERYYSEVEIPNGIKLKKAKVHELILSSDVFINVPILKHHSSARLTISMKNHMGIVWDRFYWHRNDLHQCIADFAAYRKPDLNIVDAYRAMHRNGPRGVSEADVIELKALIISQDIVAADSAAAKFLNYEPQEIPYIKIAAEQKKLGNYDLSKLRIKRIAI